jgi:glucans biosynthesis protein
MNSRMGKVGKRWRFVVEFVSDQFADPQKAAEVSPTIEANPGQIVSIHAYPYKDRHSIRVVFDLDPGSETFSEMRLVLKAANKPVSETWLYRWTA